MALNVCPNCKKDLRDYNDAVHESGHNVRFCPACHFPLVVRSSHMFGSTDDIREARSRIQELEAKVQQQKDNIRHLGKMVEDYQDMIRDLKERQK
jgi:hypothetical protein